ncbi:hypothetical protein CK203_005692 [Vitis vinifera]|uniref:Peptidase M14 domain-containing protein n=1 Tax=Vitis vinifera TaxID=29760 RepID=A0A438K484_VITVI|nr:hypothetical protein CK203_005692 [Vitis vinifera]
MGCLLSLSNPLRQFFFPLVFFVFFSPVNGKDNLTPPSFTPINGDLYHSSGLLMEEISNLVHRHPDKFTMETIETGNQGYKAESFGQHGRELITSELALRVLSVLSEEQFLPNMDPISLNSTLDKLVIKVVPMENLNGRKLVEAGELWRGVDLNRNWSVDWGKKEKDYDPYEENPGTAPFSEPETQIMRKLSISFDPHIWVNVHSGMEPCSVSAQDPSHFQMEEVEALFMPYDHRNTTPDGLPSQQMRRLLEELNHLHCQDRCMIGSGGGSVGLVDHFCILVSGIVVELYKASSGQGLGPLGRAIFRGHRAGQAVSYVPGGPCPFCVMLVLLICHPHSDTKDRKSETSSWYLAHGTATDYMYDVVRVPMAFTFEIYGDEQRLRRTASKCLTPLTSPPSIVLNDWSAAFFTIFKMGPQQLQKKHSKPSTTNSEKWVSIDEYLDGYLMERRNRYGKKVEVLEFGMQEIRTYFRLFMLSSILLLFMFCSRISKSKCSRPIVAVMPI